MISASLTTIAAYRGRSRHAVPASSVASLLLALVVALLATITPAFPLRALAVAPTPTAYLPTRAQAAPMRRPVRHFPRHRDVLGDHGLPIADTLNPSDLRVACEKCDSEKVELSYPESLCSRCEHRISKDD